MTVHKISHQEILLVEEQRHETATDLNTGANSTIVGLGCARPFANNYHNYKPK
jgi:hypothetical protein